MSIETRYRLYVAIDFGTTRSGFAYAFSGMPKLYNYTNWRGQPVPYSKTLSDLYFSKSKDSIFWGWEARQEYYLERDQGQASIDYFRWFKVGLRSGDVRIDSEPSVLPFNCDDDSKRRSVVELTATYLRKMKEYALEKIITDSFKGSIKDNEIRWCLTVPAIWTDKDKHWMRQAAIRAGLISESPDERGRLVFIYEPEAAAVSVQKTTDDSLPNFESGDSITIFDAGGGTVDISTHVVNLDRELDQVANSTGALCGSTYIDKNFASVFLPKLFSQEALDKYAKRVPRGWSKLIDEWEIIKCQWGGRVGLTLKLPTSLVQHMNECDPDSMDRIKERQVDEGEIVLTNDEILEIHEKVVNAAVSEFKKHSKKYGSTPNYVVMVGGFSNSPYLRAELEKVLESETKLLVPPDPGAAILIGAVNYSVNPTIIGSRMSALTYGVEGMAEFDSALHPASKRKEGYVDKKVYCGQIFQSLIIAGDKIRISESKSTKQRVILHSWDCEVVSYNVTVYASSKKNPLFTDQKEVQQLLQLRFDDVPVTKGTYPIVRIEFFFGEAEIRVQAFDETTSRSVKGAVNFLPAHFAEEVYDSGQV